MQLQATTSPTSSLPNNPKRRLELTGQRQSIARRAGVADPFAVERKRARSLRAIKRSLVEIGRSGRRADFEFVRRVFAEIPELRSA